MKIAPEAWPLVLPIAGAGLLLVIIGQATGGKGWSVVGLVFALVGVAVLSFFRDPSRTPPVDPAAMVSPADGKVISVSRIGEGRVQISIFLSVFDVHVNRVPWSGRVTAIRQLPGTYFHAGTAGADKNARIEVEIACAQGMILWRQISGLIARRISCRLSPGQSVERGERFGLIYFGSRMDVVMPDVFVPVVNPGDRVCGGSSVIARLSTSA